MKNYIHGLERLIDNGLNWLQTYQADASAINTFKRSRRQLRRIASALENNCAAAAYGESQVGKSYLMSSLLSSSANELHVDDGRGGKLSFINELNPSGGNTGREESTGVITRFTLRPNPEAVRHLVRIRTLSIVDIIVMLCDAYYKDVRINPDTVLSSEDINQGLERLHRDYAHSLSCQSYITEDDIYDIHDYIKEIVGNSAINVIQSKLCTLLAPVISAIPVASWPSVFALLWNRNEVLTELFGRLLQHYEALSFSAEVYIPFDAVLRSKGTILKVNWLDLVVRPEDEYGSYERYCPVYDASARCLAERFDKAFLSALTAELCFVLPVDIMRDKPFLNHLDLLDFPGSRRRESIREGDLVSEQGNMLRRGKVAYLFNKYSRTLRINSILFCQHQDMTGQSEMGETLDQWIRANIGKTPEERSVYVRANAGVSPFFIISTKFNTDLKWTSEQPGDDLMARWRTRFDNTLCNEIIKPDTYSWFRSWTAAEEPFRGIYLLRDFFWSRDQQIFRGYDADKAQGELEEIVPAKYPEYRQELKRLFVSHPFVRKHFADPDAAWDSAATVGRDGSERILGDLNRIASTLDAARKDKYGRELQEISTQLLEALTVYYVPTDDAEQIRRTQQVLTRTRLDLDVLFGRAPEAFGRTIQALMLEPHQIRRIASDIIVHRTKIPVDHTPINNIRRQAGVELGDGRGQVIEKLCRYYHCEDEELRLMLQNNGINLEDMIRPEGRLATTTEDVLCDEILEFWTKHINARVTDIDANITYREHIAHVLVTMMSHVRAKRDILHECISPYMHYFPRAENVGLNGIADSVAVLLNNFVTTMGATFLDRDDYALAEQRASTMQLDTVPLQRSEQPLDLMSVLNAFDRSREILRTPAAGQEDETLHLLPWWNNAHTWRTSLTWAILLCSDVSVCDREANEALKIIINEASGLKTL